MIDNTENEYIPIQLNHAGGVILMCRPDIVALIHQQQRQHIDINIDPSNNHNNNHNIINVLQTDILYCLRTVPQSVRSLIRRTKIWINASYCTYTNTSSTLNGGSQQSDATPVLTVVNHTTTHHHTAWLQWAHDRIDKVLGIEIYNIHDYIRMRHHWNGSGLLLHEYCHVIHQQVFGLDSNRIRSLYEQRQNHPVYDTVLRRDWAGQTIDTDLAYCMINEKEFFAELSVTYLASHFPACYDTADCHTMSECSPPITEPTVVQRLMLQQQQQHGTKSSLLPNAPSDDKPQQFIQNVMEWFQTKIWSNRNQVHQNRKKQTPKPHCNKFYPFTSGQLRQYDVSLYREMETLWCNDIRTWNDPYTTSGSNNTTNKVDDDYYYDDNNETNERPTTCCPGMNLFFGPPKTTAKYYESDHHHYQYLILDGTDFNNSSKNEMKLSTSVSDTIDL